MHAGNKRVYIKLCKSFLQTNEGMRFWGMGIKPNIVLLCNIFVHSLVFILILDIFQVIYKLQKSKIFKKSILLNKIYIYNKTKCKRKNNTHYYQEHVFPLESSIMTDIGVNFHNCIDFIGACISNINNINNFTPIKIKYNKLLFCLNSYLFQKLKVFIDIFLVKTEDNKTAQRSPTPYAIIFFFKAQH